MWLIVAKKKRLVKTAKKCYFPSLYWWLLQKLLNAVGSLKKNVDEGKKKIFSDPIRSKIILPFLLILKSGYFWKLFFEGSYITIKIKYLLLCFIFSMVLPIKEEGVESLRKKIASVFPRFPRSPLWFIWTVLSHFLW